MSSDLTKISKFLSYVLRHRPDEVGLTLDANGWASVEELIARATAASMSLSHAIIRDVVRGSDKQRFALSDDGTRIRANQGHSIAVDLALVPREPPAVLFHGTATRFVESIRRDGLRAMNRQHVHLSPDEATAITVGQRHGKPIVLRIRAAAMHAAGQAFFLSDNGVWLTGSVAPEFIEIPT
jgi:putative RNA 2'-phosphotransferase